MATAVLPVDRILWVGLYEAFMLRLLASHGRDRLFLFQEQSDCAVVEIAIAIFRKKVLYL